MLLQKERSELLRAFTVWKIRHCDEKREVSNSTAFAVPESEQPAVKGAFLSDFHVAFNVSCPSVELVISHNINRLEQVTLFLFSFLLVSRHKPRQLNSSK